MITWLQTSLGKHHRTLLGAMLVVIIGSFVFYGYSGNSDRGFSGSLRHKTASGVIDLTDPRSTRDARDLAAYLSHGVHADEFLHAARVAAARARAGDSAEDPQGDRLYYYYVSTVDRLAAADALEIPKPSEKALAEFIRSNRDFAGATGEFDSAKFKQIADMARDRLGLDDARLQTALSNAWRVNRLTSAGSPDDAPALGVLAGRISDTLRTKWTVEYAVFSRAGYAPFIPDDAKALSEFFEKNKESYRVPQRVKLRYAKVSGNPAEVQDKPTDDDLLATAGRRKDRFPLFGTVSSATFLLDNRSAIESVWREEKAGESVAAKLSETLGTIMPTGGNRPADEALEGMIKSAGLTASALPAYGSDCVPAGTGLPEALLTGALSLSPQTWRTGAIPFGDAAYVFIYDGAIESRIPALDEVKARVTADRNAAETDRLFAESAKTKAAELADAAKAGKTFADAAKAAGLTVEKPAVFERTSAPEALAAHLDSLDAIAIGGVSGALRQGSDRIIAHIASREVPASTGEDKIATAYRRLVGTSAARCTSESVPGSVE